MDRTTTLTLVVSIPGGIALVASEALSTRGPLILLPYAGILVATALLLRTARFSTLRSRVWTAMATFMITSLILYSFIVFVDNPAALLANGLLGHLWRLALMAGIGFAIATMLAYLTSRSGERVA
jgi:hypothetical protein